MLAVDDGEGNDMEETTQLPCEPSLVLGQTLFQLYMQLAVTVCASDACATRRHAPPHYKRARRELWRLAAPQLQDAYENALNEVSEMGALSVLVDAYLLRYMLATRCASSFKADAAKALQAFQSGQADVVAAAVRAAKADAAEARRVR